MKLEKTKKELMEIISLDSNTLTQLLEMLRKVKNLGEPFDHYLKEVMVAKQCLETHVIHKEGEITKSAYYITSGFMIAYYFTEAGDLRVVKILGPGSIMAGHGFLNHKKSKYNLMIFKDTCVLEITYDQMQNGYAQVGGMQELAMFTKESFEEKDLARNEMISKTGEERVLAFYKEFPMLLPPGRYITDIYIASHLHLSLATLRRVRADLIARRLL
ncbi:Crp/Fnr family transcriptional regulator [Pedobacter nutrimenti]|uniref:Crp/Fnr family transcriptional regulator n=1 Tax=Pedobacter nutrimenti TaxID=1241337 RepID=UPI00292EEAFD|nr:cyclic nucleotide-binding domain-containing protein [Pedobacter nutrimenti]